MKKIASLLLALAMLLTMTVAMAQSTENEPTDPVTPPAATTELGSVTVNGVANTTQLRLYRLLDLESYNLSSKAYSYKVNAAWTAFFATDDAKQYFAIDDAGYATWIAGESDAAVAAFAKLALAYAKANDIDPVKDSENDGDMVFTEGQNGAVNSGKFADLPLGYYLVDSSAGALCGLTTTNPHASVNAKNGAPTIDKQVMEDATGLYGDENSAEIGQDVKFMTVINVHAGAENYALHDKMSVGLSFKQVDKIDYVHYDAEGKQVTDTLSDEYYDVVVDPADDDCTFEVVFTEEFCASLQKNDRLIIYYTAMLNRNAGAGRNPEDINTNESWLEYGEENYTTHDQTKTYTYSIDIIKTDSQNTLIDGAKFRIYTKQVGGDEVKFVLTDDKTAYRRAREDEEGVDIVVTNGQVSVIGFDNGHYYLEEVQAPAGFNKLQERKEFIIADANLEAIFNGDIYSTGSGVHVVNKSGTMLPETGGVGTTLFYIFGGLMVAGAVVLLVTRKRMSFMA